MKGTEMFDAHVDTAINATMEYLNHLGFNLTYEAAAEIFRDAAELWGKANDEDQLVWQGYEEWLDSRADLNEYEKEYA